MIPALCTLVLLAASGALLRRAGARLGQAGRTVAGIDAAGAHRSAQLLEAARDEAATAIRDRRAGRDRPSTVDR